MKEDIKYPYIGKLKGVCEGGFAIFNMQGFSAQLDDNAYGWRSENIFVYNDGCLEDEFKNITREYLANTYGEVESKDHAEFIIELAESAKCTGLEVAKHKIASGQAFKGIYFNFYTDNGVLWFSFRHEDQAKNRGEKQITIPMPPKEVEAVGEWPQVCGEVVYKGERWDVVAIHRDTAMLFWTKGEYCTAEISELSKLKTPEAELRDELSNNIGELVNMDASNNAFVDMLIEKYNITKKQ